MPKKSAAPRDEGKSDGSASDAQRHKKVRQPAPIPRIIAASLDFGGGPGTLYSNELMAGLVTEAGRRDRILTFINLATPDGREKFFQELAGGYVDGVLLVAMTDRAFAQEVLGRWLGPIVLIDHYFDGLPITGVVDDSLGGSKHAVEHLLSLGHRRIGYADISRRELNPWRYAGYESALQNAGIAVDSSIVVPTFGSFEAGKAAGDALLSQMHPPTAIFAFDDTRAWGIWRAAEARGMEVGRDLALVGYGDLAPKAGFPEDLTTVRFDPRHLGRVAVEKVIDLVTGKSHRGELVELPTQLIIRRSSAGAIARR
ncbi:MAG: hypothetical protein C0404_06820 [Verrucomicrobia bacterium]|nr:hypothetical protein [Verrucomicrobiota bacterium]